MPTLSIVWISMVLLLNLTVMEVPQGNNVLACESSESFWKRRLLHENNKLGLRSSDETSRLEDDRIEVKRECATGSTSFKTLVDYDGPTITGDLDDRGVEDFASHVRVKRSAIATHGAIDDVATLEFDGLRTVELNRKNESAATGVIGGTYRRSKREVLLKNRQRRKRVKGNVGHSKHRMKTRVSSKENSASKSTRKFSAKGSGSERRNNKKTMVELLGGASDEARMESRVEKRASGGSDSSGDVVGVADSTGYKESNDRKYHASLIGDHNDSDEQRRGNVIASPLVHTAKAELRVRIEKISTNESSFVDPGSWTNPPSAIELFSTTSSSPKDDIINEITDSNVTNLKLAPDFNSGKNEANISMTEIALEKFDSAEIRPTISISLGMENNASSEDREDDCTNRKFAQSADENAKSRAKRNQEIRSKCCLRSDTSATGSKRSEDTRHRTSIANVRHERTQYEKTRGNRAVRSIEEIKQLAEKLVVKVNELQVYVNNYSESLHTTDSPNCPEKTPKHRDTNHHRHSKKNNEAVLAGKRASRVPFDTFRFAREYRNGKRSRKWSRWTDWSSCSVTCGKGRQIRWRHCMRDCDAETEMEEKACQLPACLPGSLY